ncbi:MAG: succinylglutamate desuccinylase/aspartoacylase family protein [Elusimicrobiota bacterium]
MIDIVRYQASLPGPHLLLLGGVHGDEKPGVLALEKLMTELEAGRLRPRRGTLTLAPRVNAEAVRLGLHGVDENLNRIVRRHAAPATREQALANELLPLLEAADATLDLHGTPAPSPPFVFLDDESPETRAWAESLGARFLLTGWPALYAGGKTITTTECAHALGKLALTVEVGQNDDGACAELGLAFAVRSMAHFGLTDAPSPARPPRTLRFTRVVYREREGSFARAWSNFDPVSKGELLARRADGTGLTAPEDSFLVMPFSDAKFGEEWYYLAVPV